MLGKCFAVQHQIMNTAQLTFIDANNQSRTLVANNIIDIAG